MSFYFKIPSIVLVFLQIVSIEICQAASSPIKELVLMPAVDGDADIETKVIVDRLYSSLKENSKINLIKRENVESVLRYHKPEEDGQLAKRLDQLIVKAKENYYKLNYIEAKSLVKKAISEFKISSDLKYGHGNILREAYLTLGIILRSMGNVGEAREAFIEVIRLDPECTLDPRAFSPSMVGFFREIKESITPDVTGEIVVKSDPEVARVYLDGLFKGVTPVTLINVPEGEHPLEITANNYLPIRRDLRVEGDKKIRIKEKLKWTAEKKGVYSGREIVTSMDVLGQVEEGLRAADLLKVDKVAIIDYDKTRSGPDTVAVRLIDKKYRTGHNLLNYNVGSSGKFSDKELEKIAAEVVRECGANIASDPERYTDPIGKGDIELMQGRKKKGPSKGVIFGVIGGVLAAGLGAGLAAAFAGGSANGTTPGAGSLTVNFR